MNTVKLLCNDYPWDPKNSGCCGLVVVVPNETSKWWSLQIRGRYLEVVVRSGLTVSPLNNDPLSTTATNFASRG